MLHPHVLARDERRRSPVTRSKLLEVYTLSEPSRINETIPLDDKEAPLSRHPLELVDATFGEPTPGAGDEIFDTEPPNLIADSRRMRPPGRGGRR
jgi:hypothetical protein